MMIATKHEPDALTKDLDLTNGLRGSIVRIWEEIDCVIAAIKCKDRVNTMPVDAFALFLVLPNY